MLTKTRKRELQVECRSISIQETLGLHELLDVRLLSVVVDACGPSAVALASASRVSNIERERRAGPAMPQAFLLKMQLPAQVP